MKSTEPVPGDKTVKTFKVVQVTAKFKNGARDWIDYLTHITGRFVQMGQCGVNVFD